VARSGHEHVFHVEILVIGRAGLGSQLRGQLRETLAECARLRRRGPGVAHRRPLAHMRRFLSSFPDVERPVERQRRPMQCGQPGGGQVHVGRSPVVEQPRCRSAGPEPPWYTSMAKLGRKPTGERYREPRGPTGHCMVFWWNAGRTILNILPIHLGPTLGDAVAMVQRPSFCERSSSGSPGGPGCHRPIQERPEPRDHAGDVERRSRTDSGSHRKRRRSDDRHAIARPEQCLRLIEQAWDQRPSLTVSFGTGDRRS